LAPRPGRAGHFDMGTVLIVGHEPSLSDLISSLCDSRQPELQKAGVVEVWLDRAEPRGGRLKWLAQPRDLEALAHGVSCQVADVREGLISRRCATP
jgi:hypothetical protein